MSNFLQNIKENPLEELKIFSGKFISIGFLSKYPEELKKYINDLEENCHDIRNFELVVAIPDNDEDYQLFEKVSEEVSIELKIFRSSHIRLHAMKSLNIILDQISDQNTYFYIVHADRARFACKNWDLIIKQYINCVPDDMFFLRGSNFSKNIKLRISAQDSYYNPEQWAVYTRKYLRAIGSFPEFHTGHDGACEMIQHFINKNNNDSYQRDILMPNIMHSDIRNISSKETIGGKKRFYERYYINNFFYKSYFNKKNLESYKKSSIQVLLQHIIWKNKYKEAKIVGKKRTLSIQLEDNSLVFSNSYKLNLLEFFKEKYYYFYGSNHGLNFAHRFYFIIKYELGFSIVKNIVFFFNQHIQNIKNPICSKFNYIISTIFSYIANLLTFIFLTEPISNELEGLFRGDDFKDVLHGKVIKEAYQKKLYNKSLENIARELEEKV